MGVADAGVSCRCRTEVRLPDHACPIPQGGKLVYGQAVGRSVVDDDDLEIPEGLRLERCHEAVEKAAAVEAGYDDTDRGFGLCRTQWVACQCLPLVRLPTSCVQCGNCEFDQDYPQSG